MIQSVRALFVMLVFIVTATPGWAGPDGSVNARDVFGNDSSEAPASPSSAEPEAAAETKNRPAGSGPDPSAAPVQVRTGLSPNEVKRELTPAEQAARLAEEQARRDQAERDTVTNALMLFIGVVLLVLVLGGMAYAVFAMLTSKPSDDEGGSASEDDFSHLIQRDPTPAPAPHSASSAPATDSYLGEVPAKVHHDVGAPRSGQLYPDTPASIPARHASPPPPTGLYSADPPSADDAPLLSPTPTPAPMIAARKPADPTPAGYVPPRRPAPTAPRPPSPGPRPMSVAAPPSHPEAVTYGQPVPVARPFASVQPRRMDLPKGEITPVPTFSTVPDPTDTPSPERASSRGPSAGRDADDEPRQSSATPPPMPWRKR